ARNDPRRMFEAAAGAVGRRDKEWTETHGEFYFQLYVQTEAERNKALRESEQRHMRRVVGGSASGGRRELGPAAMWFVVVLAVGATALLALNGPCGAGGGCDVPVYRGLVALSLGGVFALLSPGPGRAGRPFPDPPRRSAGGTDRRSR